MSGPSDKAVQVAHLRMGGGQVPQEILDRLTVSLEAAHDPALGLDRSVCLRDVLDWADRFMAERRRRPLRSEYEHEFGGGS